MSGETRFPPSARRPGRPGWARSASALVALVLALGLIGGYAPSPTDAAPGSGAALALGPYRYVERSYDLGRVDLSVLGADGRTHRLPTRLVGEITAPVGLAGPLPVVLFLHGAHQSCAEGPYGLISSDFPCPPGWEPVESYPGYRYVARVLASRGYLVVSVDGRPVAPFDHTDRPFPDGAAAGVGTWMDLRARIVDAHLRRLVRASAGESGPGVDFAGIALTGRVDATRVALVGHSRGGEGVVWAALLAGPRPYRVASILAIAPVDFARRILPSDIPFAVVLPTCDGDVSDLQGADFYDDARNLRRTAPLLQVAVHGANHDFFNTAWEDEWGPPPDASPDEPGASAEPSVEPSPTAEPSADPSASAAPSAGPSAAPSATPSIEPSADPSPSAAATAAPSVEPSPSAAATAEPVAPGIDIVGPSDDSPCSSAAIGTTRLTRAAQERVGATIVVDFVDGTLLGDRAALARLGEDAPPPRTLAGTPVTTRYQAPTVDRMDIAPLAASPYDLAQTAGGGRISPVRLAYLTLCSVTAPSDGGEPCPPTGFPQAQVADELRVGWSREGAALRLAPSTRPVDMRGYEAVALSVAVTPHDADPTLNSGTAARPFSLVLVDSRGRRAEVPVSSRESAVRAWPTLTVLGTVRIPLARFTGVDLARIVSVELAFDRTARGAILVTDVAAVR